MIHAKKVTSEHELYQILELQQQNLRGVHQPEVEKEQGFVTVTHNLDKLRQMHRLQPSIIAKDREVLAGYALSMPAACSTIIPELFSLFARLHALEYKGRPLHQYRYYVMGQVCVAAAYRGKGVFDQLYAQHRASFSSAYDIMITDIATRNTRSLRAHERVGFRTIETYRDALEEWAVVAWDWNSGS